jgi:hypothetical protein
MKNASRVGLELPNAGIFLKNNNILINNCRFRCCFYEIAKVHPVGCPTADSEPIGQ